MVLVIDEDTVPAAAAQRVNQWGDDRRTNRAGGNEMNEGRKESRGSIQ